MSDTVEMYDRVKAQYVRFLRVSLAQHLFSEGKQKLVRWAVAARYLDLERMGKQNEAERLMAWRDAERARLDRRCPRRIVAIDGDVDAV